jgi:hypothetical protein
MKTVVAEGDIRRNRDIEAVEVVNYEFSIARSFNIGFVANEFASEVAKSQQAVVNINHDFSFNFL